MLITFPCSMKEKLETGYRLLKEDGIFEVSRAASRELNRMYYDWQSGSEFNARGVDVHEEDWDNLIILDACRYDFFDRYCDFPGTLEHRISRGSTSQEFIRGNFANRRAYDTVYLSDNGWYGHLYEELDSELYHFSFCERDAFDGTVSHPSTVTESAIEYNERHPKKRMITHYMQPHAPYFDTSGEEVYRWPSENHSDCDPEEVRRAYANNLQLVLSEVSKLLDVLVGKTVITADHGELLGERLPPFPLRQYQHPKGIYVEELVKVPWFVIEGDERKEIVEEDEPAQWSYEDPNEEDFEGQLKALGYL